jgi:hypothetical protein
VILNVFGTRVATFAVQNEKNGTVLHIPIKFEALTKLFTPTAITNKCKKRHLHCVDAH